MKVSKEDAAFTKTLLSLINEADFGVKGKESHILSACMKWTAQLELRIEADLAEQTKSAKEVKEPIRKVGK